MSDHDGDPFVLLGLHAEASAAEVRIARRDLAKQHHPDTGGDADVMRSINAAAEAALQAIAARIERDERGAQADHAEAGRPHAAEPDGVSRDMPSFTVEALPVETYEALLVVTGWIGKILDDDPPYRLDTHLYEPGECWCRLELVPDAGASTVSMTLAPYAEQPVPPIELVRDTWIEQLNRYDWP